jgi:hypothetical protein
MQNKRGQMILVRLLAILLLVASVPVAFAASPSETAQSIMVSVTPDDTAYEIVGTITWTFQRGVAGAPGCAMDAYTNTKIAGPFFVGCGGGGPGGVNCAAGNAPSADTIAAAEPAPNDIKREQQAQSERCTFFSGGDLTTLNYSQDATVKGANGNGAWKYSWDYAVAPISNPVGEHQCWTALPAGDLPDPAFTGFVSSESYVKTNTFTKYSFTLLESGVSRVQNVSAQLQHEEPTGSGTWVNVGAPIVYATPLPVTSTAADYTYFGNGGVFGKTTQYINLHATGGGKPATLVSAILLEDTFPNNNNDLASGNVHEADFDGQFFDLSQDGHYRVTVSGTLKGNTASGVPNANFAVSSSLTVIGGCTLP